MKAVALRACPLTLTLSPGGGEGNRTGSLSLTEGEGWGEGGR